MFARHYHVVAPHIMCDTVCVCVCVCVCVALYELVYRDAYHIACLGVTYEDWRLLALEALEVCELYIPT